MNEIQTEVAEEELLHETRVLPLRFARGLRDLASFELAHVLAGSLGLRVRFGHRSSSSSIERLLMNNNSLMYITAPRPALSNGPSYSRSTLRSIDFMDDSNDTRGTAMALRSPASLNSLLARAGIHDTTASTRFPRPRTIPAAAR